MIFFINKDNPQSRLIKKAVSILENGGVIVYPTDTVYAFGCDIRQKKAIEKIYRIKKIDKRKPLSFIFTDIASINKYSLNFSNAYFKILKKALPGPYTFILKASKVVPSIVTTKQKTIGVRIPNNNISIELVKNLGYPILSTSVVINGSEYPSDVQDMEREFKNCIDLIIDSGAKNAEPSTIIDLTGDLPVVVREGKGKVFF